MSLVLDIKINSTLLKTVVVSRTEPKASRNTYVVSVIDHEKHTETTIGTLKHTAGDGAVVLASKAIALLEKT